MKEFNILKETRSKAIYQARAIQKDIASGGNVVMINKAEIKFNNIMVFIDTLDSQIEDYTNSITKFVNVNQLLAL